MEPRGPSWEGAALDYEVQRRRQGMIDAQEGGGWRDWAVFAAVVMWLVGAMSIIDGVAALRNDPLLLQNQDQALLIDVSQWGWAHVIIGAVVLLAGIGVLRGRLWARVIGVAVVTINAFAQFLYLPVMPVWSIVAIALDVGVILALTVHGREIA